TLLHGDTFHQGYDFYCTRAEVEQAELAEYLAKNPAAHCLWPRMMTDPPPGIFAGFAMGTRAQMLQLHRDLQAQLPGLLHTHVLRSPHYQGYMCEIAPHGVTKWTSVLRLAEAWGIGAEEICAAGDDVNDLHMIVQAGLGVAMGNAQDEVKAAADRIAPSHDDDGLVQVVDWLLEQ
ncbi:MAG TPA: HAD hydrolase family protein, partial [Pirellulales bacterium]|nr:HAD hydrolase family protein [Pirellulales bacterium]